MKNLIALVAIAFGAYIVYTGNADGLAPIDALKAIAGLGGGTLYLVVNNFTAVKNGILGLLSRVPSLPAIKTPTTVVTPAPVVDVKPVVVDGMLSPNKFELNDNVALVHLRNRLVKAKNHEGIELCSKLATILFTLDVPEDDEVLEVLADAEQPDNVKASNVKQKITV